MNINLNNVSPCLDTRMVRKRLEKERLAAKLLEARKITSKLLEDNPDVNVDFVIDCIKSNILPTIRCAEQLGISPKSFLRLRKKYNIDPVSSIAKKDKPNKFAKHVSYKAIRNYYSVYQLKRIPQFEIELSQKRAGKALKLSNKVEWLARGVEDNGKLKPRTEGLVKHNIYVSYLSKEDKYKVTDFNKRTNILLSRKEVDKLNLQYLRLKAFI